MDLKQALAQALRKTRTSRGLTQEDFGDVSSRTYVSTLERGLKSPTLEKLVELAARMDVHPLSLLAEVFLLTDDEADIEVLFARIRQDLDMS
ncbi:helix-turn-helix transcriptional regulator [Pseudomonas alkylphenolica]|uniref:helix-turn-helix domain-containing protein n=1 Tax=Pseudomonas alkylphenolica TaxID=237609 RepID=UPI00315C6AC2